MSGRLNIPGETQRVWVCVLKTSDLIGLRRRADRPRVVVKALTKRPGFEPVSYTHLTLPTTPYV